jgi:hypothetical protein
METQTPEPNRSGLTRSLSAFYSWLRGLIGNLIQFTQRSQLEELGDQTRRLGSASVESATYVSGELRALDQRLSRIEAELADLRGLLERGIEPAEQPARVAAPSDSD